MSVKTMDKNTDSVQAVDSATTVASEEVKMEVGLGCLTFGPFMPILSGNYRVQILEVGVKSDTTSNK